MNPQDKLKELQRQIEAFKCGMEARYGKYWKDRADSTSLARYAEMIGKEKGYKQALEDVRIHTRYQLNILQTMRITRDADIEVRMIAKDIMQILTIPEEE